VQVRRSRARRRLLIGGARVLLCGLVVLTASCGSSEDADPAPSSSADNEGASKASGTVPPCTPPEVEPLGDVETLLPKGITLPPNAELVSSTTSDARTDVVVQSEATVSDLHARYIAQVKAAGYEIVKLDDEGHEAEVYFTVPGTSRALVQQVRSRCPAGMTRTVFSVER
jgi:hypothetical protein